MSGEQGKWTKGPWGSDHCTEHRVKDDPGHWQIDGPTPMGLNGTMPYTIADTSNRNYCISPDEDTANARLIAAAPDLYRALELAHRVFIQSNDLTPDDREMLDEMWAALRKADGDERAGTVG